MEKGRSNLDLVLALQGIASAIMQSDASEQDFSTSEVSTGRTWVNGNPIYKKTVAMGALPNNTTKLVNHGITGIDYVIDIYGTAKHSTDTSVLPLPYSNPASTSVGIYCNSTQIAIVTGADRTAFTSSYITLLYTKS